MNPNFNSDYDVRLATLGALGGDTTIQYDSVYEIDIAILNAIGGGAIPEIVIDDNTISTNTTYSSNKIVQLIADAGFKTAFVDTLPLSGDAHTIYFVPSANPETQNQKDEFMWTGSAWEQVGSTAIDLSGYYTKTEIDNLLNEKQDVIIEPEVEEVASSDIVDVTFVDSLPQEGEENQYVVIQGENIDNLYQWVNNNWEVKSPETNVLYFNLGDNKLYNFSNNKFIELTLTNTYIINGSVNSAHAKSVLDNIRTFGTYQVIQHTTSAGLPYMRVFKLEVASVDREDYNDEVIYQELSNSVYRYRRASKKATGLFPNFTTYYVGYVRDALTTSPYFTWSVNKITSELATKQDLMEESDTLGLVDNMYYAKGYNYDPERASFSQINMEDEEEPDVSENSNTLSAINSVAFGGANFLASGAANLVSGYLNTVWGRCNLATGYSNNIGDDSTDVEAALVLGSNNTVKGDTSFAMGYGNTANGYASFVNGAYSTTSGNYSFVNGYNNNVTGNSAFASGNANTVSGTYSTALGSNGNVSNSYSTAIGYNNIVSGNSSTAIGYNNNVSGDSAVALNRANVATGQHSFVHGYCNIEDTVLQNPVNNAASKYLEIVGNGAFVGNVKRPSNAYTLDWVGNGWFKNDVTCGGNDGDNPLHRLSTKQDNLTAGDNIDITNNTIKANGYRYDSNFNFAEQESADNVITSANTVIAVNGDTITVSDNNSDEIDTHNVISRDRSNWTLVTAVNGDVLTLTSNNFEVGDTIYVAMNPYVDSTKKAQHAEGRGTITGGNYAHAEGNLTIAKGNNSHSEGYYTEVTGTAGHVEGYQNKVTGRYGAHAEGCYTLASGDYSHAEGFGGPTNPNNASGSASHSEGVYTSAEGYASHAEGWGASDVRNRAIGFGSHVEGCETIAYNKAEHAQGGLNVSHKVSDTDGDAGNTLHSIGDSYNKSVRNNALEIMQNADMYIKGVGGYQGTDTKVQNSTIKTVQEVINGKQDTLTSGQNIEITNNTISALGYDYDVVNGGIKTINVTDGQGTADSNSATGKNSLSLGGDRNICSGARSVILGGRINNNAGSQSTIIGGTQNTITTNATNCTIIGGQNTTSGNSGFTIGNHIQNVGSQTIIGEYNIVDTQTPRNIFIIGNGNTTTNSNALEVSWNGEVWGQSDVTCLGTSTTPLHKLSNKLDRNITPDTQVNSATIDGTKDLIVLDSTAAPNLVWNNPTDTTVAIRATIIITNNSGNTFTPGYSGNYKRLSPIPAIADGETYWIECIFVPSLNTWVIK